MQGAFEQVSSRASLQGALNLDVSRVGGEHDDAASGNSPGIEMSSHSRPFISSTYTSP